MVTGAKPLSGLLAPSLSAHIPAMAAPVFAMPLSETLPAMRPSMPGLLPPMGMRGAAVPSAPQVVLGPPSGVMVSPAVSIVPGLPGAGIPRGVDLDLNQFALDTPQEVREGKWVSEPQSAEACATITDTFWSCLNDGLTSTPEEDESNLLKRIFNPTMSDRRMEGDRFVPPDTSLDYVDQLRNLVR